MNKIIFVTLALLLAACNSPAAASPTATDLPTPEVLAATATDAPTETPEGPGFETSTYRDEANGFEVDYPANWNHVGGEGGSRGYYQQILSWQQEGSNFDQIPEGGSVLEIAVFNWEPVNDLDARLEMRRRNIVDSGNIILDEEAITLASGVPVVRILVETTDGQQALFYFATVNGLYLELTGNGDIATIDAAIRTLRYDS